MWNGAAISTPGAYPAIENTKSYGPGLEATADGWYFSEVVQTISPLLGGSSYVSHPGKLMRFDTLGNMLWSAPLALPGEPEEMLELPSGDLIYLSYSYHAHMGAYSVFMTRFTPSGSIVFTQTRDALFSPVYMINTPHVIQLTSGTLLGTATKFVWTSEPDGSSHTTDISSRFYSESDSRIYGLYPAANERFYALCQSGLVEFDTMGNVFSSRSFVKGSLLKGYHGDTLLWYNGTHLFKADTSFTSVDSVLVADAPMKVQLNDAGIWWLTATAAYQYDHMLNLVQTVPYPPVWFSSRIYPRNACVSGGRVVVSGVHVNAAWKAFDFAGNTVDPDYNIALDSIQVDSVVFTPLAGGPSGTLTYVIRAFVRNAGTETVDSLGICDLYRCNTFTGLNLLAGQSKMLHFGITGPPNYSYDSSTVTVTCTAYSPNQKLDKNTMDNVVNRVADIPMGVKDPSEAGLGVRLAPNPAGAYTELIWEKSPFGTVCVCIHDLSGRPLQEFTLAGNGSQQLALGNLAAGCYLVKVEADGKMGWLRLVRW